MAHFLILFKSHSIDPVPVPEGVGLGIEVDETKLANKVTPLDNPFGTDLAGLLDRTAPG